MTAERLTEIEAWAAYARASSGGFVISAVKAGEWLEELVAEVRRLGAGHTSLPAHVLSTVHLVAPTGLGYTGRLVDCASARRAGAGPCALCGDKA